MKVSLSWSGGKDSAMALFYILNDPQYEVVSLHTVFDEDTKRVGMHGVHETLIEAQAQQLGIALDKIYLPKSRDHNAYEEVITTYCKQLKSKGVENIVYGDIFLEDLKHYRETQLSKVGMHGIFPLWLKNTRKLLQEFWLLKFKTFVCAGKDSLFDEDSIGCELSSELVNSFSDEIDPCGENGEFHSYVVDGPLFKSPISVKKGLSVYREYNSPKDDQQKVGFWFKEFSLDI